MSFLSEAERAPVRKTKSGLNLEPLDSWRTSQYTQPFQDASRDMNATRKHPLSLRSCSSGVDIGNVNVDQDPAAAALH